MKEHLQNKIFDIISEAADGMGCECYVIGGYVRDIFLKRESKDIDVVVVSSGEFSNIKNNPILQSVYFSPVTARYVLLKAVRMVENDGPMGFAELGVQ
jgi:tRNA nucleotidyltransferase/poly(A) polymerase